MEQLVDPRLSLLPAPASTCLVPRPHEPTPAYRRRTPGAPGPDGERPPSSCPAQGAPPRPFAASVAGEAERLAAACQAGSIDAFESLVELLQDRVTNFLWQITGNRQDAEDLTQETFVKAYRGIQRYQPAWSFATWLFTIAKRTAYSHLRVRRRFEPLPANLESFPAAAGSPAGELAQRDEGAALWRAARRLKPRQFEALWLRYGEGFTVAEAARVMGTNQVCLKVLLHRARKALAKRLVST